METRVIPRWTHFLGAAISQSADTVNNRDNSALQGAARLLS